LRRQRAGTNFRCRPVGVLAHSLMPRDERIGDNAHQESRNELIASDHLSEQPVFWPLPRTPINLNGSMSALPCYRQPSWRLYNLSYLESALARRRRYRRIVPLNSSLCQQSKNLGSAEGSGSPMSPIASFDKGEKSLPEGAPRCHQRRNAEGYVRKLNGRPLTGPTPSRMVTS
jgi:hypothetical protein